MKSSARLVMIAAFAASLGLGFIAGQPHKSATASLRPVGPPEAGPVVRPTPEGADIVPNPMKGPSATIVRQDFMPALPEGPLAGAPVALATTLWDQPPANVVAQLTQIAPDAPSYSSYMADDFSNAVPWSITSIFVAGATFTTLQNAEAMTWSIYPVSGPTPPGYPGTGPAPFWTLTLPTADPQITITTGTFFGYPEDVTLNLSTPISLPPGNWWLQYVPTLNWTSDVWYWQSSTTSNGSGAQWINPGGGFGSGTNWIDTSTLSYPFHDVTFRLEGAACDPVVQDVNDGGFENVPSAWTEWDSTGCLPWIGDWTYIFGIPPRTGSSELWAGGYCSFANSNYAEQTITLPSGSPVLLRLWTVFYRPDADDPGYPDTFYVSVNGTQVFTEDMVQANNTYPNWVQQTVDLTAYAGQTVILRIGASSLGSSTGNVLVDDLTIAYCAGCSPITIDPATLPAILSGVPFSQMLTASGGTGSYTFAVTGGTLPAGLTLDPGGLLSGTPTFSGGYSFTITATDAGGCTGEITYTGTALKFYFLDDYARSKFCVDTVTGSYLWNITWGPESGTTLTGAAKILNAGGKVTSLPGDTNGSFSMVYDPVRHKASGWLITAGGHYVPLTDKNTTDNPGACDWGQVPQN